MNNDASSHSFITWILDVFVSVLNLDDCSFLNSRWLCYACLGIKSLSEPVLEQFSPEQFNPQCHLV